MAAYTCGWSPAGGSNSLPDGSVHVGRGTRQLHDVTGKVQHARLIIAAQVRELRVAVLEAHFKFKNELIWLNKKANLAFGWTWIPGAGVKDPLCLGAQDYTPS